MQSLEINWINYTRNRAWNQAWYLLELGRELDVMNGKEDKILNVEELANFFGVTAQTIWRWCKSGKIPAFKIGSQWKIRQSDLNKIINQKLAKNNKIQNPSLF